jgi:predicted ATPase/class 3 adenylate cyclase
VPGLPSGTVTLLFTDIEGSTRLLHQLGDRYGDALADHRRLLRECFRERDGREVDTQGDAFFVAFATASQAVAAAVAAQRRLAGHGWPGGVELRVRMGIHTGEPTPTDEGYVGVDLHRGARICAAGHGGQVLVSEATRQLLLGHEPAGVRLRDLGPHRLKDLTQPQRLYQVVAAGLLEAFPPLKTLEDRPTNLPAQPTPLLGRTAELAGIGGLLGRERTRLVTLTGPGGTGKTRLALQAAADALDDFPGGVFLVTLAAIRDPGLVVPTVARTLGVREGAGRTVEEALGEFLGDRQVLLLLDNFEQVVEAAPEVAGLLAACPGLSVLVTSREPLRLSGEQEYPVPPLPVPDRRSLARADPAGLSQYEAVALFIGRAQAVKPSFQVTADNAPAVAEICVRLDGLPLAIELAAARIKVLSPQAVLDRLGRRLRLLTGGARGLPARQQTLRGTIDWSYDLLSGPERRLFARLAVFVDGWTLEAAEAVCDPDGDLEVDVLDGLASLVDKSLVRQAGRPDGEPRFGMLETVREYALERLEADQDPESVRDRHATYFTELSVRAQERLRLTAERGLVERLEEEHGNLRAALVWLLDRRRTEPALELVHGAWRMWLMRGRLREGQALIERVLEQSSDVPSLLRDDALAVVGEFYRVQGDFERARRAKEASLPGLRRAAPKLAAATLTDLGEIAEDQGRYQEALRLHEEALAIRREIGEQPGIGHAMCGLGRLAIRTGELPRARSFYEAVLEIGRRIDDHGFLNEALLGLAEVARRESDDGRAERLYRESVALAIRMGDLPWLAVGLAGLAAIAVGRGQALRATRLLGAVDAICAETGIVLYFPDERDQLLAEVRRALDPDQFAAAWAEGRAMTPDEAAADALDPPGSD